MPPPLPQGLEGLRDAVFVGSARKARIDTGHALTVAPVSSAIREFFMNDESRFWREQP